MRETAENWTTETSPPRGKAAEAIKIFAPLTKALNIVWHNDSDLLRVREVIEMRSLWIGCVFLFWGAGMAQEDIAKQLQSSLKLPIGSVKLTFGFRFALERTDFLVTGNPFTVSPPPEVLRIEREKLEGQLSGDLVKDAPLYLHIAKLSSELGEKERAEREWQRAFEAFQALVKKEPKNWKWHIYMSEALSGLGKEKEADALLEETAKRFRKQWQVWMAVGINRWIRPMRNFVSKMESVAEDALQTLKGEGTTDLEIWGAKILGLIEPIRKGFRDALPCWERAHKLAPDEPVPLLALSLAYYSMSMLENNARQQEKWIEKAKKTAWEAAERKKLNPFCIAWAILLEGSPESRAFSDVSPELERRIEQAINRLEQLVKSENQPLLWALLGVIYLFNEKETKASECFKVAIALEPEQWVWHEWLFAANMARQRFQEALQIAEDYLSRNDFPRPRLMAAVAAEKLGDWEKVEEHIKAALQKDENDFYANLSMVVVELKKGEPKEAVQRAQHYWERISKLSPPDDDAKAAQKAIQGVMMAMAGHYEEAKSTLREVLEKHPIAKEALAILEKR
jgi:tetratricopeptide (TPR) repeat protein